MLPDLLEDLAGDETAGHAADQGDRGRRGSWRTRRRVAPRSSASPPQPDADAEDERCCNPDRTLAVGMAAPRPLLRAGLDVEPAAERVDGLADGLPRPRRSRPRALCWGVPGSVLTMTGLLDGGNGPPSRSRSRLRARAAVPSWTFERPEQRGYGPPPAKSSAATMRAAAQPGSSRPSVSARSWRQPCSPLPS